MPSGLLTPERRIYRVDGSFGGNEMNDRRRVAALDGDGFAVEQSLGVFRAATNLRLNGGAESNATGWTGVLSGAVTRTTTKAKFGSAAIQVVTPGTLAGEGVESAVITVTTTSLYTESVHVWAPLGATMRLQFVERIAADLVDLATTNVDFVGTGDWQYVSLSTATTGTTVREHVRVLTNTTAQAITFYVDGSQLETTLVRTPYIETNGSSATRNVGFARFPWKGLFDETQGWACIRCAPASDNGQLSPNAKLWSFGDVGASAMHWLDLPTGSGTLRMGTGGTSSGSPITTAYASLRDLAFTAVAVWTAVNEGVSVNGGALAMAGTRATVQTYTSQTMELGADVSVADRLFNGRIFWAAFGRGILTAADVAYLHSFGNSAPDPRAIGGECMAVFDGNAMRRRVGRVA